MLVDTERVYKFGSDEKIALAPGVEIKGNNQTFRETRNIFGSSLFVAKGQAFPGELVRGLERERERERGGAGVGYGLENEREKRKHSS